MRHLPSSGQVFFADSCIIWYLELILSFCTGAVGWFISYRSRQQLESRLYRGRVPRLKSDKFTCCHTRDRGETMISVLAVHIILTPTQPVGSEQQQRRSNPGPPHQDLHALPTELLRPPPPSHVQVQLAIVIIGDCLFQIQLIFYCFFCLNFCPWETVRQLM